MSVGAMCFTSSSSNGGCWVVLVVLKRIVRNLFLHGGKLLERDKIDVDNLEALPRTKYFLQFLRMRCAKMCARGTGCRKGGFSVLCMQCECVT